MEKELERTDLNDYVDDGGLLPSATWGGEEEASFQTYISLFHLLHQRYVEGKYTLDIIFHQS